MLLYIFYYNFWWLFDCIIYPHFASVTTTTNPSGLAHTCPPQELVQSLLFLMCMVCFQAYIVQWETENGKSQEDKSLFSWSVPRQRSSMAFVQISVQLRQPSHLLSPICGSWWRSNEHPAQHHAFSPMLSPYFPSPSTSL